jgi:eukaryotic-like serine/threonine-protein kinase
VGVPSFSEGDILAGKYRIDRILGAGGMGVVVAAHHIRLDERVAIKFLLPEMMEHGEAVARFEREARAAVKIKSEHVARVSDVGTLENGAPYMVMEYLQGSDLADWLRQRGPLPIEQAVDFLLQACEAIAEAHSLGIVHRDLKPANLFVIRRPDGSTSVKVLDFGISKMRGGSASVPDVSITKTSTMMGSPLYMSPEQMQSAKDADHRADIWALGIILQELLTGASPFMADTVPELVAKILSTPPPSLRFRRPDAPEGLERVISTCLEKDRNRRFGSIADLALALAPYAPRHSRLSIERISGVMREAGFGASTVLPPSSNPVEPAGGDGTQASWGRTNAPRSRTGVTLLLVASVSAVLAAGAFLLMRKPTSEANTAPTSALPAPPVTTPPAAPSPTPPPIAAPPVVIPTPVAGASAVASALEPSRPPASGGTRKAPRPAAKPQAAVVRTASPVPVPPPSPVPIAPKPASTGKSPGAFDDRK